MISSWSSAVARRTSNMRPDSTTVGSLQLGLDDLDVLDPGVRERLVEVRLVAEDHDDLVLRIELLLQQGAQLRRRRRRDLLQHRVEVLRVEAVLRDEAEALRE